MFDFGKLIKENGGYLRISSLDALGIDRHLAYAYMSEHPEIHHCGHGLYFDSRLTDPDHEWALSYHKDNLVYSHETAMFLLGLIDVRPAAISFTMPAGYNTRHVSGKLDLRPHTIKKDLFTMGIIEVKTTQDHIVRCYNKERTICDMVKKDKFTKQKNRSKLYQKGLRNYFSNSLDADILLLEDYASKLNILPEIQAIISVMA